jgi:hypothetical protein
MFYEKVEKTILHLNFISKCMSREDDCVPIAGESGSLQRREMNSVYFGNNTEHINTLHGRNAVTFMLEEVVYVMIDVI